MPSGTSASVKLNDVPVPENVALVMVTLLSWSILCAVAMAWKFVAIVFEELLPCTRNISERREFPSS